MSLTSWALFIYYKLLKILSQSLSFFFNFFFVLYLWNSFSKLRFSKFFFFEIPFRSFASRNSYYYYYYESQFMSSIFLFCFEAVCKLHCWTFRNFSNIPFFFRSCVQAAPLNQTIDSQHDQFLAVYGGGQPPTRHATIFQACGHHHNAMRYCPRIFALVVAATWITSIASWFGSSRTVTALTRK